jgi:hypothetical protein
MLQEAETIMLLDQPVAPLYQYTNLELWRPEELQGLLVNPWDHRRLENVKVLTK